MILQALADFDRRQRATPGEAPAPEGYSIKGISFAITLNDDGDMVDIVDLRLQSGNQLVPRSISVPQEVKRASGILPNLLWDKTQYALGLEANDPKANTEKIGKRAKRLPLEHGAFVEYHNTLLAGEADVGLQALLKFLLNWKPEKHAVLLNEAPDLPSSNVIFRLSGDICWLHDRPAAVELVARRWDDAPVGICLITGENAPRSRLHPPIMGVWGGQSSGGSIVSFNIDAFESYGKKQGANAPVAQSAAEAYVRALNTLLAKGSRRRVQIADTSTVFWAERDAPVEDAFMGMLFDDSEETPAGPQLDTNAAAKIRAVVDQLGQGRPLEEVNPEIDPDVRYYVLGLAPNAARISIRFWFTDTLGILAERFRQHWLDLRIEPSPFKRPPALWRLLRETAVEKKMENVPKQVAGEVTRSILSGGAYPRSLLANVIMRIRADGDVSGARAAIIKAVLVRLGRIERNEREDHFVSLNSDNIDPAYRLGRLFAVLEGAQIAAQGRGLNATIRDKYYAAASATPASIFPLLLRTVNHHLSSLRKDGKGGLAFMFEKRTGDILSALGDTFPRSFPIDAQGRFAIGYYHEKFTPRGKEPATAVLTGEEDAMQNDEEN
jgi:CRISPR-associated protein Csd1